jgi:acyl-CoA synthetase (AMP-forming)/AMP-acid ligase II
MGNISVFRTPAAIDFGRLLEWPARFFPERLALVDEEGQATFAELERQADAMARAFRQAGAVRGDRIALMLPNGIPFVVTELAAIRSGLVKVPLNTRFHLKEVLFALADCEPTLLVCDAQLARESGSALSSVPSLRAVYAVGGGVEGAFSYEDALGCQEGPPVRETFAPDDPIVIRYTGGTTGRPKGIVHTAGSFLSISLDVVREFALRREDVALHVGHLSHGLNYIWPAMFSVGMTQILRERFEPRRILEDIETQRVSFLYMVPTMIHRLLREDDGSADTSSLRLFLYSSAPMPVPLLREAIARYGKLFTQVYTLSEAPVITTIFQPDEHEERETLAGSRLGSCGREVVTMAVRLLDAEGREVEPGEAGEIAVRSANNMAGYWRRPEETAATLVDGWVMTGDMARRDEDGFLYIVDRKKDMIITGALNVYPKEVEDVLHDHPAVAQSAVIGVPDDEWGEIIRAYVVLRSGQVADEAALIDHCRNHLASYKKPRQVRFVETLPLSPVGKVSRVALREQARGEFARHAP